MSVAICTCTEAGAAGPHCPLLLYAGGLPDYPECAVQAVQYDGGYKLTNAYLDGVIGVSEAALIEAECDDSPTCRECGASIEHWDHEKSIQAEDRRSTWT